MSAHNLPDGLTRGYSNAFVTMICEATAKALTIKELKDLDDAELAHQNDVFVLCNQIESDHEAPAAA